ncbi:MAG: ATP-binding protein [Tenericutes bacterium]|jgi:two-component system phosphate regulon sensor histidine kinase PhoR|nr:ATP-binding protein [Mycoplasmatota bacterium]
MRRRISLEFVLIIVLSMAVFIIGATLIARNAINNVTELNLNQYLEIIEIETVNKNYQDIVDKYDSIDDYLRITFIDENGVVLADSLADELDNHLNRPEIQNIGEYYIRYSDTIKTEMMYLAIQLDNGDFLRVAIPTTSILKFLNDFIGLSLVIGTIIIALSIFSSSMLINHTLKPLKDIKNILINVNEGEYQEIINHNKFDETSSLIKEINKINHSISSNISSLKSEKRKTDFLLDHMNQGICVLNRDKEIILLNKNLRELYRFNIDLNLNKNYRFLFREEDIQIAIQNAYESKTSSHLIIKEDEEYFNVSITYLNQNWNNQSSVIIIYTDVTSIKHIETLKRDFFMNASHELKSPLTSIIGSSELITQGMAKDEEIILDLVKRIHHEANRMSRLVMDMLLLSEVENKQVSNQRLNFSTKKVIDDVIKNLSVLIKEQNTTIHKNIDIDTMQFGEEDLFQLIKNLVENAIKYGENDGQVWIDIFEEDTYNVVSIKDDGIGIPHNEQSRIFERFYRIDKARSRSSGGTGLGLSIVKHIVMNVNGHIKLESDENNGTSVTVYLPR